MSGVKFLKACQVRDKIIQIFPNKKINPKIRA